VIEGSRFQVLGMGFGVSDSEFRVYGLGSGHGVLGVGFGIKRLGFNY
jgi:hypothetical protein